MLAVIVSIAGILTIFGSNLIKQKYAERLGVGVDLQKNATKNTIPTDICTSASFKFYSGKYDKTNMNLYLVLENQRSVELEIKKLYLFYPNNVETFELNNTLEGNILKSYSIPGVNDGFDSGTIKTNCPGVEVDFIYSQLT
jgi:hypothetical protein